VVTVSLGQDSSGARLAREMESPLSEPSPSMLTKMTITMLIMMNIMIMLHVTSVKEVMTLMLALELLPLLDLDLMARDVLTK